MWKETIEHVRLFQSSLLTLHCNHDVLYTNHTPFDMLSFTVNILWHLMYTYQNYACLIRANKMIKSFYKF